MRFIIILVLSFFVLTRPIFAIDLRFPVVCHLLQNCWITNHVDLDRRANIVEDYMCGSKTTDGAQSTHISLGSINAVAQNIPVVATAEGIIKEAEFSSRFCGVRVLIDHGKGWESSYCHLNPETLMVQSGQKVTQGHTLGTIGTSGQTDWPRLSYALVRNGMVFDPFSNRTQLEGCSKQTNPMWVQGYNPLYEPAHVTNLGFNIGEISASAVKQGTIGKADLIKKETPQISLWALFMNVQKGDEIDLRIIMPDGRILSEETFNAKRDEKYYAVYLSKLRRNFLWDEGRYIGRATIKRYVGNNRIETGQETYTILK